ncbi:MAG: hypothetical protein KDJ67_15950, partial [Nitratireductor sp.]|nr:hypothetical protein [Nitratireductor sp.]
MTTITVSPTPAATFTFADFVDFLDWLLIEAVVSNTSPTSFTLSGTYGGQAISVSVTGAALQYQVVGPDTYVIGGTVTELQITADSVDQGTIYTSIDMAVLAPIIADDASGTTPAGIENFFLSADWNYTAAAQVIAPEGALVGDNVAFNPVGNDDVVLSNFDDVLFSGDGNDTVAGGQGNDTVNGGLGDDTLVLQGVLADYTFSANGNGWFTVVDSQTGRDGTDIFTSFENVQFSDTTVQLWSLVGFPGWTFGTSGPDNPFNGTTGNDVLAGLEGDDFIYGFEGEDTFSGGAGNDTIDGGSGTTDDANFFWDAVDYHFEQFQGGFQGVTVNLATGVATDTFGNTDTLIDIERIFGTNFADNITGGNEDEGFDPNGGNDTIDGGGGFDQLIYQIASGVGGFQGINATFTGTNSGTVIDPWGDTDTFSNIEAINGTEFDDTITGNSSDTRYRTLAGNDVIDGGGGFDFADYARDASYGGTGGISFNLNNVDGNGFSQVIDGFGDTDLVKGVFRFRGTGSSDTMVGDNNDSRFDGGDSADVLSGGGGVDDLRGDNGDDVITGGLGNDSLTGGNDADKFIFAVGDGQDTITDFDFAEGDRIVIGSYGFTSTGDFSGFSFNGTDTIIDFNGVDQVTVAGVDLTALVDPNAAFDFAASGNVVQGTPGNDVLNGTGGDDLYLPGDTDPFGEDVLFASGGNDEFDFVGAGPNGGFYSLAYWQLPAFTNLTVTIGVSSGTIVKDGIGTDTLTNIDQIDGFIGGLGLYGPFMGDDTFIIDPFGVKFFDLSIGGGTDTLAVTGVGTVRVGFDAYNGVVVDANAGTATEVGGSSSLTWTGFVRQWRGSNSDDSFTGTSGDEHFITEQGNDTVDGGGGFDTVRYDRAGVTSVRVEYSAQGSAIVTGVWNGTFFTDTLTNIEAVRGARVGLTEFSGSAGDETFIARGGINYFYGDAGNDTLNAGGTRNLFEFDSGSGQDTINNFVIGRDAIDLSSFGFTGTGSFNGYSFDGTNTIIDLNGTDIITVTNVNLTVANASDIFTFNLINGTAGDENAGGLGALNGTANNDVIDGQGGNDELYGNDGNDILRSGGQDFVWTAIDVLNGGAGDDLLVAEGGTVRMIGGAGNDLFVVTNAFGDPWWDTGIADYSSSTSGIIVNLTSGIVSGLQSGQVSDGLGGTDFFQGVNLLRDSDHDDVIVVDGSYITQNGNVFEVRLSGGNDSVDFTGVTGLGRVSWQHASDGVVASLATGTAYDINLGNGDQIGNDTFINANLLRGSQFGDELYGNSGNNFLRGEGGDDYIDGAGGTDMAQYWSSDTGIVVDLSLGTGQVIDDGKGGTDTLVDIERITASIWDDQLTGGSGADWLAGVNG